jgi:hypothetical protein
MTEQGQPVRKRLGLAPAWRRGCPEVALKARGMLVGELQANIVVEQAISPS